MILTIFSDRRGALPADWTKETAVAIFGDAWLDGSSTAGPRASLTFVGLFGDLTVRVPPGSRIRERGFSLFGDRQITVAPGDGPEIRLTSYGLFGDVTITDQPDQGPN